MSSSFKLNFLEEISAGDADKLRHLMNTFIEEAPKALIKLKDYYKVRNFDGMAMEAHAVKPLYLSVGAEKAALTIKNIENYSKTAFFHELIPVEIDELDKINNEICAEMKNHMQINL
jgi:hypothetical protein